MGKKVNFIALAALVALSLFTAQNYEELSSSIDTGDTAWMLVASAFVLLMTPGLSFFYGGMMNKKNIISTMLQSFVALGVISVLWVVVGFSLAFGTALGASSAIPLPISIFKGWAPNLTHDFLLRFPFSFLPFFN